MINPSMGVANKGGSEQEQVEWVWQDSSWWIGMEIYLLEVKAGE